MRTSNHSTLMESSTSFIPQKIDQRYYLKILSTNYDHLLVPNASSLSMTLVLKFNFVLTMKSKIQWTENSSLVFDINQDGLFTAYDVELLYRWFLFNNFIEIIESTFQDKIKPEIILLAISKDTNCIQLLSKLHELIYEFEKIDYLEMILNFYNKENEQNLNLFKQALHSIHEKDQLLKEQDFINFIAQRKLNATLTQHQIRTLKDKISNQLRLLMKYPG